MSSFETTIGTYKLCLTVDGGASFVEQSQVSISAHAYDTNTAVAMFPSVVGPGASFDLYLAGVTPLPSAAVGFSSAPSCSSIVLVVSLSGEGPVPITFSSVPGRYSVVC